MKNILVIDDDLHIGNVLEETLTNEGYGVIRAYSGTEAVLLLSQVKPDLVLLDLMLPGLSGEEVLPHIKGIPVIIMSAKVDVDNKVALLLGGAVDYMTKPFKLGVLLSRIRAALRRSQPDEKGQEAAAERLVCGDVLLDKKETRVQAGGKEILLTAGEYRLLEILLENKNRTLTRTLLLQKLWDIDGNFVDEHALTSTISRVRSKIENPGHAYIKTVYGMGYMWIGGGNK